MRGGEWPVPWCTPPTRSCICQSFTLVDDLLACNWVWLQDFWCLTRSQKLLQCNLHQRQIWNEVCVTFWDLTIYKYIKILYWLVWLFWLLTWPLTLWFIILPKVLRSLPTSRRDHFLLLCSRELLIWAKLAAARKSGFWADCSGGSCKLVINLTINISISIIIFILMQR